MAIPVPPLAPKSPPWWFQPVATVVVPAVISAAVAIWGYHESTTSAKQVAIDQYQQNFAAAVRDLSADFRDDSTAGLAFAALSQMANDESQKRALVMIGTSSKSPSVHAALVAFLKSDADARQYVDADWSKQFTTSGTPNPATAAIISVANPSPPPEGWVYYGQTGTTDAGGCRAAVSAPDPGQQVTFCGSHYVRSKSEPSGAAIGVLTDARVFVRSVAEYKISKSAGDIWVSVNVPTPAPVKN